jgi:hypothetical protein
MIGQVLTGDDMPRYRAKDATCLSFAIDDTQVVQNEQIPVIESYMIVWAQTQYVLCYIWSVMRATKWANMSPFSIGSGGGCDTLTTHLTAIVVELFDCLGNWCIPHQALYFYRHPRGGSR